MRNEFRDTFIRFDSDRAKLIWKSRRLEWDRFHGKDVKGALEESARHISGLSGSKEYRTSLRTALSECTDERERRELVLRTVDLLSDGVESHPDVGAAMGRAIGQHTSFKYVADGQEMTGEMLNAATTTEQDSKRRKYLAGVFIEQSAGLKGPKVELVKTLNRTAREVAMQLGIPGITNWMDVVYLKQDVSRRDTHALIRQFERKSRAAAVKFLEEIKRHFGISELRPWDVQHYVSKYFREVSGGQDPFPRGSESLELLRWTLRRMGFDDVNNQRYLDITSFGTDARFVFDLDPGPNAEKDGGAFWFGPSAYGVMVHPDIYPSGIDFTTAVFNEAGHVLHYNGMDRRVRTEFYRAEADCFRDAMAMVIDSLLQDPGWLHVVLGLSNKAAAELSQRLSGRKLLMARGLAEKALFESLMYSTPGIADRIFESVAGRFDLTGTGLGMAESKVLGRWASHPYYVYAPGGYPRYALGYVAYSLVASAIRGLGNGSMLHPKAAEFLVNHCYGGRETPWIERLRAATGRSLSIDTGVTK